MARHFACATFQRPVGAIASETDDSAGDAVVGLLPPAGDGVWATQTDMLSAIMQPIVQINFINAPFIMLL
jgi:hypothetical protein